VTFLILVQNRRKDQSEIIIYAGLTMAMGNPSAREYLEECQSINDEVCNFEKEGQMIPWIRVFHDAWDDFRASILSVNGAEYQGNRTFPRSKVPPPQLHLSTKSSIHGPAPSS